MVRNQRKNKLRPPSPPDCKTRGCSIAAQITNPNMNREGGCCVHRWLRLCLRNLNKGKDEEYAQEKNATTVRNSLTLGYSIYRCIASSYYISLLQTHTQNLNAIRGESKLKGLVSIGATWQEVRNVVSAVVQHGTKRLRS
eukprot:IDg10095t1